MIHQGKAKVSTVKETINFYTLFWTFIVGSVIGFCVEGIWAMIMTKHWEHHAATLWGPFCIIYGIGALLVFVTSYSLRNKNIIIKFITFFLTGAFVEYFGSLFQEICFGSVSWNYSSHFMNIGGRVSLVMALVWGTLGILFMYFIYPKLKKIFTHLSGRTYKIVTLVFATAMLINISITALAVARWKERLETLPPSNKVEELLDDIYGNEKMDLLFSNMNFVVTNSGDS